MNLFQKVNSKCLLLFSPANYRTLATFSKEIIQRVGAKEEIEKELSNNKKNDQVTLTDDGQIFVCWHPEQPFPYEFSKPLPTDLTPTENNLKIQALTPVREIFGKKNEQMMVDELVKLTHTHKVRWYGKARMKKLNDSKPLFDKRDREYL